jgi:hypothetical protein
MHIILVWNDFEFYNMTGFYVYFNDDMMQEVVHMQAWTLGIGETVSIGFILIIDYSTNYTSQFPRLGFVCCP